MEDLPEPPKLSANFHSYCDLWYLQLQISEYFTEAVLNQPSCTDGSGGLCNILKVREWVIKGMQGKGLMRSWDHHTGSNLGLTECCNSEVYLPQLSSSFGRGYKDATVPRYTITYPFPLDLEMYQRIIVKLIKISMNILINIPFVLSLGCFWPLWLARKTRSIV